MIDIDVIFIVLVISFIVILFICRLIHELTRWCSVKLTKQ